jgi:hypothetical protein
MDMRAVVETMPELGTLEPEPVLPDQLFARARIGASLVPEKGLMLAVLRDAVRMYQMHARSRYAGGVQLFTDAEEWILSDDTTWPYSFVNVCQALDLDVDHVRGGLARWKGAHAIATGAKRGVIGASGLGRAA